MKKLVLEILICPACLPDENRLTTEIIEEQDEDILSGSLTCRQCGKVYPITNGIAFLDPTSNQQGDKSTSKYESSPVLSSYMWSHYGDLLNDSNASTAYTEWADLMHGTSGLAVDAGCAVGRFAFEMTKKSDFVIGIDNSLSFIKTARDLMIKRRMKIDLVQEGLLTREESLDLHEPWDSDKVEFIVGDALALPFRSKTFSSLASLNLVDKVPLPIKHLREMNRAAKEKDAQLLFSDPFSWSKDVSNEEDWLGGTDREPYSGRGIENVIGLLKGERKELQPEWNIEKQGHVWWKIRAHSNYFELIRSCFVKAHR